MSTKISLALCACLFASAAWGAPSKNDKEIEALKAQLQELSTQLNEIRSAQAAQQKHNESIRAELTELNDRTDEIEFSSGLDKVKMGFDFSTAVSQTHYKINKGTPAQKSYNQNGKWYSEFHLNMSANVNEKINFYGRLAVAKGWTATSNSGGANLLDSDAGRGTNSGPAVYLSQAYIDWMWTPELIATIGRQPGTDGPGSNLRNNAVRQATYPALMLNVLGDGVVLTYKPEFLKDYDFNARIAYAKIYQWDQSGDGDVYIRDWMQDQETRDSNLYYLGLEGQLPLGDMGKNLFVASFAYLPELSVPAESDRTVSLNGGTATLPAGNYPVGEYFLANLHFENYKTFGTPLNWFLSLGYNKGSSPINNYYHIAQSGNAAVSNALAAAIAQNLKINEKSGFAAHAGVRYDFTEAFKLGLEGFYGSRYWYTFARPSINDPLNIRSTRGYAYDLYAIYQIDQNQFLRLSYTGIDNRYSNRGAPVKGSEKQKDRADNFMLMYHVRY